MVQLDSKGSLSTGHRAASLTGSDAFFGLDGPMWDAKTLNVPLAALPAGTISRKVSLHVVSDPLAWAYSVLAYQY